VEYSEEGILWVFILRVSCETIFAKFYKISEWNIIRNNIPSKYVVVGMGRRSRVDIVGDILSLARKSKGVRITEVIYGANLNYGLANRYLDMLLKDGLLSGDEQGGATTYKITDKGLEVLKAYRSLRGLTQL